MRRFPLRSVDEIFKLAMASGQLGAAVNALKELGMLSGKRIERAERGEPGEFDRMSDGELRQAVADRAEQLGFYPQEQNTALNVQFSRSQAIKFLEASAHQERSGAWPYVSYFVHWLVG